MLEYKHHFSLTLDSFMDNPEHRIILDGTKIYTQGA